MKKYLGELISFQTPQGYLLDGVWFGKAKNNRAIIYLHGLSGSIYSRLETVFSLAGGGTSVLSFNNRGSGKVNGIKKLDRTRPKGYRRVMAGEAHEVFIECVDDIAGAIDFCISRGAKEIYLMGHSTGCQKSIYYLTQKKTHPRVKGAVLLCPVSDYAAAKKFENPRALKQAETFARRLVKQGKQHQMLPLNIWPHGHDAQRFLSLYTPNSKEEIFTYAQPRKKPATLMKVSRPLLFVFAGADEYHDRPVEEILTWFSRYIKKNHQLKVIPGADHTFTGKSSAVVKVIKYWFSRQ